MSEVTTAGYVLRNFRACALAVKIEEIMPVGQYLEPEIGLLAKRNRIVASVYEPHDASK